MTDYEFGQKVMAAAGVRGKTEHGSDCEVESYDWGNPWRMGQPTCTCSPKTTYPDPLTPEGHAALWDALSKLDFYIQMRDGRGLASVQLQKGVAFVNHTSANRFAALRDAAAQVLEVSR